MDLSGQWVHTWLIPRVSNVVMVSLSVDKRVKSAILS